MSKTKTAAYAVGDTGSMPQRIIRRGEIEVLCGYCIDHLYALIRDGRFPKPIHLGPRAVGWLADDIAKWQAERIAERDGEAA